MHRILSALFVVLSVLLLGVSVRPGYALEIVYPADGTYVTRSNYLIVKAGEAPAIDGLTIEINGVASDLIDISSPEYKGLFQDFLIVEPEFDGGTNQVRVEGYQRGKVVAKAVAEIYFMADFAVQPPDGFAPYVMHVAEREALCAPCHNMNPTERELAADTAAANPCGSCHRRMLEKKHVHGPAGVYECTTCHDAASRPAKYRLIEDEAALCNECHFDKVEQFRESKFVHGPVEAGYCLVCHDSHATDNPAQLLASTNQVCLACHEGVQQDVHVLRGVGGKSHPLGDRLDPSGHGRMLSCASCHNPHGGMTEAMFQRGISNRFVLCQICHQK